MFLFLSWLCFLRDSCCQATEFLPGEIELVAHLLTLLSVQLFELAAGSPLQELLRDLEMIAAIAHRANRRVSRATSQFEQLDAEQSEQVRHQLDFARQELRRLAARIPQEAKPGKEQEHVESKSASHASATTCSGSEETRDRAPAGYVSSERAQGASLQLRPGTGAPACGESRTLSATDPGVVGPLQGESCTGP